MGRQIIIAVKWRSGSIIGPRLTHGFEQKKKNKEGKKKLKQFCVFRRGRFFDIRFRKKKKKKNMAAELLRE